MCFQRSACLKTLSVALVFSTCFGATPVQASVTLTFANGDQFDGDGVGDTVDLDALSSGLVLTTSGLNATGVGLNSVTAVNMQGVDTSGLGINSVGSNSTTGDVGGQVNSLNSGELEFWSFSFNQDILFKGIDLIFFGNSETLTFGSDAWSGLSVTPGSTAVSFSGGIFELDGVGVPQDNFTLSELTDGDSLRLPAGSAITIQAGANTSTRIQSLSLWAVPEPASCFVWLTISTLGLLVPHRRKRSTSMF